MKKVNLARAGERGISPRAPAAAHVDEAPGRPGAERKAWGAGVPAGTARSPTGAVSSRGRAAQRLEVAVPQRAGVTYINLCVGTPYGDPVKLAKAIAEYYGLKLLAVVVDDGDEPAVAYARSKEIRERIFAALESEDLEEALAKRFARTRAVVLSIFDGEDTIIAIAR
jgi:hypothetical protein